MPGMSQFAALVVELAAKLGQAVPSAKVDAVGGLRRWRFLGVSGWESHGTCSGELSTATFLIAGGYHH